MVDSLNWFDTDRNGLAKLLERRGKAWAIFELIQNSWDCGASNVLVALDTVPGRPLAKLTVTDDHPDGFKDLTHAFTLFAESEKKGDETKRGRFNLGCKLVLAMCTEATVSSTTGAYRFDETGRHKLRSRNTRAGSVFAGTLRMTREELADVERQITLLYPPGNTTTYVRLDGAEQTLAHRAPERSFTATLTTEAADADGYLRRRERMTSVHVHRAGEAGAWLCEMGLPVMPLEDCPWSVDVQQKIPLGLERDSVSPTYLARIRALVLSTMARDMAPENFSAPWVAEAVQHKDVAPSAVAGYLTAKYGDKFVIDVPGAEGQESVRNAVANGYSVIRGGAEGAVTWDKIKEHGLATKATVLFPPPKASNDYRTIPLEELSDDWDRAVVYAARLGKILLKRPIKVRVIDGPNLGCLATWQRDNDLLTLNRATLGEGWFARGPDAKVHALLIHEFAHAFGDHLSEAFDDAMADLGAQLVEIALASPAVIQEFRP